METIDSEQMYLKRNGLLLQFHCKCKVCFVLVTIHYDSLSASLYDSSLIIMLGESSKENALHKRVSV